MPIDPVTGSLILGGINLLGGLFGGGDAPEDKSPETARIRGEYDRYIAELQAREAQRQYNISQAQGVTRQLEQLPMRDQINYLVSQRLGMAPSEFRPRDLYNPSTSARTPELGGLDLAQYRQRAGAYQPGMGGLDPVYEMYQTMGADLGYGNEPLMDQRGVFGGNRNPGPGQLTYDASPPQSGMGGYNPHAPYGSDWTTHPNRDLPDVGVTTGVGGAAQGNFPSSPQQQYMPLNQPSYNVMAGGTSALGGQGGAGGAPMQGPGPGGSPYPYTRVSQNYQAPYTPQAPGTGTGSAFGALSNALQRIFANQQQANPFQNVIQYMQQNPRPSPFQNVRNSLSAPPAQPPPQSYFPWNR